MGTNSSEFVTLIGEENCDHWPTVGKSPGCHKPQKEYQKHAWGVAMNRALEHACWSNALQSQLGSMVLASNPSSATGSWYTHFDNSINPNGPKIGAQWLSANIQYTPDKTIVQPPMHAQSMIGNSQLPHSVRITASGGVPSVNFSLAALASADGKHVTVRAVNLNATAVTAAVQVDGDNWAGTRIVLSGALDAHNTPTDPNAVVPNETQVSAQQLRQGVVFGAHSFTVLQLNRSAELE